MFGKKASWRSFLAITVLPLFLSACLGGSSSSASGLASAGSSFSTCSTVTYAAPSGAANNITFTFNKAYQCGQFANGDWWVSPDQPGGRVTVVSITPDGVPGKHGYEVNPSDSVKQAFDVDAQPPYDASLMAPLPLSLGGVSSVLKSVSIVPNNPAPPPSLQFAAVLTVLDAPLANSAEFFRPTYVGGAATKIIFRVADVRANLLPKWPATGLVGVPTISSIAQRYANVWPDHISGSRARFTHPIDNMPDYGADMSVSTATSLLRLVLNDYDYSQPIHKQALINYLQMAIDVQGAVAMGTRCADGGGQCIGRKLPLAFASWIFNDSRFQDAITAGQFQEDFGVYRSGFTGQVLYGDPGTDSQYYQHIRFGNGSRSVRDPYQQVDGGSDEVGSANAYQGCCTSMPWKYTVLAVYRLGIAAQFNNTLLPEYVERWVSAGTITQPDTCAPYDGNPANYGITYGPLVGGGCILDTNPGNGVGRYPTVHGALPDGGFRRSGFGDSFWVWHKANP